MSGDDRRFSILTPVYDPPEDAFLECAASVMSQTYPHWEWCIANDNSPAAWVRPLLDRLAASDARIKVVHRDSNGGISAATNDALAMATGEFVVLLDHDDLLTDDALGVVNHYLALDDEIDYLYSDEDKIDPDGSFFGEFPKPDWSPERLLGQNYCCHLSAIRRDLLVGVGGFRSEYDGAQDYDVVLRVTERARKVEHVPEVLYHWRMIEGSTATDLDAKPYAVDAGRRAVADALARRGVPGDVVDVGNGYQRVRRRLTATPRVSIVIPTRGTCGRVWGLDVPFVVNFVDSVRAVSTYPDIEIVVVHDTRTPGDVIDRMRRHAGSSVTLVEYDEPFNFSKKCNLGALAATGDIFLFANDDMEVRTPEWIERMICFLEDPTVGLVGPLLLFDNYLVQSAGHQSAPPSHFGRGLPPSVAGGPGWPFALNREVMGVTGACMAVRRDTFWEVGGFSLDFPLNYNDVDFGFKIHDAGYRIIWTPDAEVFHFESKSRETDVSTTEWDLMLRLWGRYMKVDPYLAIRSVDPSPIDEDDDEDEDDE